MKKLDREAWMYVLLNEMENLEEGEGAFYSLWFSDLEDAA